MIWLLDGFFILCILIFGLNGFNKGLIEEFGRLLGLFSAVLISISNTKFLAERVNENLNYDGWITTTLTFTLLFIITLTLARLLTKMLNIAFLNQNNQIMNRTLGFTFGTFKGFIIIMSLVWFIALLPVQKWSYFIEENSKISRISNDLRKSMVSFFNWEDPVQISESYIKQLTQP